MFGISRDYVLFISIALSFLILTGVRPGAANISCQGENGENSFQTPDSSEAGIRIGLLLPVPSDKDPLALSAREGAELAIRSANREGGYRGIPFSLVVRTADGLWGAGSSESVKFVYDDKVVAIVTALDGRNAHLTEQVAAKSHIVQLATRSTEETLSQAFVPWFFRIVPNDRQQAEALVREIYHNGSFRMVYGIYEKQFDSQKSAESFEKSAVREGFKLEALLEVNPGITKNITPLLKEDADAIVVFGTFERMAPILEKIRETHPTIQVFGSLSMTADGLIGAQYSAGCDGGIFITSGFCYTTAGHEFRDNYLNTYGHMSGPAASYAYEGVNLLIEAIRKVGPDREKIRDRLKENKSGGITGQISFDQQGNRTSPVFFVRMIKGHPVILHP